MTLLSIIACGGSILRRISKNTFIGCVGRLCVLSTTALCSSIALAQQPTVEVNMSAVQSLRNTPKFVLAPTIETPIEVAQNSDVIQPIEEPSPEPLPAPEQEQMVKLPGNVNVQEHNNPTPVVQEDTVIIDEVVAPKELTETKPEIQQEKIQLTDIPNLDVIVAPPQEQEVQRKEQQEQDTKVVDVAQEDTDSTHDDDSAEAIDDWLGGSDAEIADQVQQSEPPVSMNETNDDVNPPKASEVIESPSFFASLFGSSEKNTKKEKEKLKKEEDKKDIVSTDEALADNSLKKFDKDSLTVVYQKKDKAQTARRRPMEQPEWASTQLQSRSQQEVQIILPNVVDNNELLNIPLPQEKPGKVKRKQIARNNNDTNPVIGDERDVAVISLPKEEATIDAAVMPIKKPSSSTEIVTILPPQENKAPLKREEKQKNEDLPLAQNTHQETKVREEVDNQELLAALKTPPSVKPGGVPTPQLKLENAKEPSLLESMSAWFGSKDKEVVEDSSADDSIQEEAVASNNLDVSIDNKDGDNDKPKDDEASSTVSEPKEFSIALEEIPLPLETLSPDPIKNNKGIISSSEEVAYNTNALPRVIDINEEEKIDAPSNYSKQSSAPSMPAEAEDEPTPAQQAFNISPGELLSVNFDGNTTNMQSFDKERLLEVIQQYLSDNDKRIKIISYAKGIEGQATSARRISLQRAIAVRLHLIQSGLESSRINVQAMGNREQIDRATIILLD